MRLFIGLVTLGMLLVWPSSGMAGTGSVAYADPPPPPPTEFLRFVHVSSGRCLSAGPGTGKGTPVVLVTCDNGPAQQWRFHTIVPGSGEKYVNVATGQCLDVENKSKGNGAAVHLWNCQDKPGNSGYNGDDSDGSQAWRGTRMAQEEDGSRETMTNVRSGKCIDVPPGPVTDRTRPVQQDCKGQPSQVWRTVPG